jgi:hypothetical protein
MRLAGPVEDVNVACLGKDALMVWWRAVCVAEGVGCAGLRMMAAGRVTGMR